ncbi:hypothetical protein SLEP1_g17593 [Rubroshorea leprosula]|uniref:Uncharacterized protein n=1 Tax=Rubroshorea leprosula TaxID=152421 RepID=A0AAV5J0B6_9ROSI|nr:hypothetical protein SLEP1_g17593 [Rubroshorea leprosula]
MAKYDPFSDLGIFSQMDGSGMSASPLERSQGPATRINPSTKLPSLQGRDELPTSELGDRELGSRDTLGWSFSFIPEPPLHHRSIEILRSIRSYAQSQRVQKPPFAIAMGIIMCSAILLSLYEPLRKGGVRNLYELRRFRRLLVVKRGLVVRINYPRTLRSHFGPPQRRGDLVILVKNSARSLWKFRRATQATRKPVIVGDLVDDQIVFYEEDLLTGAHYRSEIAIVGLGLATWVELESSD